MKKNFVPDSGCWHDDHVGCLRRLYRQLYRVILPEATLLRPRVFP